MENSLDELELATTRRLHAFIGEVLGLFSLHFSGQTTLNHLRVGNFIGMTTLYEGLPTSNTGIANALNMPRSTVSRIVSELIEAGWVLEQPHPEDGRRRELMITPGHVLADDFEKDFRAVLNELLESFQAGEIVVVDPAKKSY